MGIKLTKLPELLPEDLTDLESHLCLLVRERDECIQELRDELARLKGEKGKPKIKPSRLESKDKAPSEQSDSQDNPSEDSKAQKKRPGSEKRHKTVELTIHETKVIPPGEEIPPGSEFKGDQDYTVQELIVRAHNTPRKIPDHTGQPWSKLPRKCIVLIPKIWMGGSFDTKIIGLHPRSSIRLSGMV